MMSREYEAARAAYWEAQRRYRVVAIDEMLRLEPQAKRIMLEINDTPRLTVVAVYAYDGVDITEDVDYDALDQIASDMEAFTWDEAASFLTKTGDGSFEIERQP